MTAKITTQQFAASLSAVPNAYVRAWIVEMVQLCQPDHVRVLDGSAEEKRELLHMLESLESLTAKVQEAVTVLQEAQ